MKPSVIDSLALGLNTIIWKSPFNEYIFIMERSPNQLWNAMENQAQFVINITIKNNLGIIISNIMFSEIDAVRILDCMDSFIYDFEEESYSSYTIELNPLNPIFDIPIIYLLRLLDEVEIIDDEDIEGNCRDILFTLRSYSFQYKNSMDILKFYLSNDELSDLIKSMYHISFDGLNINPENNDELNDLLKLQNNYEDT